MAIYTVHEPAEAPDAVTGADRTVFIREGWSVWGLVFGPVFLLWHRLWLAVAIWIVLAAAITGLTVLLHQPAEPAVLLAFVGNLFIAVEGNDLRRWQLERAGFRFVEVVAGSVRDDAELVFFNRRGSATTEARPLPPWRSGTDATPAVIGMFPDGSLS